MTFAERKYEIEDGGTIRVGFFEPVESDNGIWRGAFEIEWPLGRVTRMFGEGVDKLDALLTAVALVRVNLEGFEAREGRKIAWEMGSDYFLHAFGTCSDLRQGSA
jgi:hypothetical protein